MDAAVTIAGLGVPIVFGDVGAWFWVLVVAIYVIASIAMSLRRAAKQLSQRAPEIVSTEVKQAEQSPQGQRLAHAVQTIKAQAQAAAAAQAAQLQARAAAATTADAGSTSARQALLGELGGALQRIASPALQAPSLAAR